MAQVEQILQLEEKRPIIEHIIPLGIERWREEGLFKRSQKFGSDIRIGQKIRFVLFLRGKYYDYQSRELGMPRERQYGITRDMLNAEKHSIVRKWFDVIEDTKMRDISREMILSDRVIGARYIAKKLNYAWEQFVIDFNIALEQMINSLTRKEMSYEKAKNI